MKKLLTLFTLLLLVCSGAWGAATYERYFVEGAISPYSQSAIFTGAPTGNSNSSSTFNVDGTSYSTTKRCGNGSYEISFTLPSGKTGRLWAIHNQSSRHFTLTGSSAIDRVTSETGFSSTSGSTVYADVFDVSEARSYTLTNSQNIGLVALILRLDDAAPSTPTLTGAWKIGDDEVTSVNVVQGGSVTMPTFTVGATSGDPSGKYNVSYAFKSGYQSGIFEESEGNPTITSNQPSIASTAVTGTATIVATLTTTDAESFAQPTTNTFEYTVTINAPAAPTFSPGAGAVASGTEITMTSPDGGEIWYTTNGVDPTESNKTVYDAEAKPTITDATTIKAIARVNGYSSAVTTADYTIIAMLTQNSVSTSRTWDWSKLSAVGALTDVTNPTNAEDFVMANMDGVRYSDFNLGFNSNFTQEMAQEIVISNTQYVKRSGNGDSFQNGTIKINFAVPGKLTVYFTGTNNNQKQDGSEDPRYLVVNSSKGTVGTNGTTQVNETFDVVVGDNTISFEPSKPLRIQKLVFVEAVPVEVSALGYATFASDKALDFTGKSISAYKATVAGTTVNFTQVNVVPAGEGVLLYADGGATVNVPVTTADADDFTGNKLVRGTGASLTYEENVTEYYILANETAGIGFYKANGNVVATNKAYLDLTDTGGAKSFVLPGGETDGIKSVQGSRFTVNGEAYNLAGQRVGKDYKGIVIVNGKKMLNK